MRIDVNAICGPICVDPEDGDQLRDRLSQHLQNGDPVQVDFTSVSTLTSSFLNAAIGALYETFSAEELVKRISWLGLDQSDQALVKLVQENAVRFYAATPELRERLVEAAEQAATD